MQREDMISPENITIDKKMIIREENLMKAPMSIKEMPREVRRRIILIK